MNLASLYQTANSVQRHDAERIIKEYIQIMQWRSDGGDMLLDVGCGSGNVLMDYLHPLLPPSFGMLVGSDISANMVAYARRLYAHYERTKFEVLDIGTNKLPKHLHEQFDHVTSFYCLHWVQNQRKALENIYQLLRRNSGDCLLVFLADNSIFNVYRALAKACKWSMYMQDVNQFISPLSNIADPSAEYGKLLQQVGFSEYNVEIRNQVYVYEGVASLKANVKAVCPFLERIPEAQHEEFLNDIVDTIVRMKLREQNVDATEYKFISSYKLIVVYARKAGDLLGSLIETVGRQ